MGFAKITELLFCIKFKFGILNVFFEFFFNFLLNFLNKISNFYYNFLFLYFNLPQKKSSHPNFEHPSFSLHHYIFSPSHSRFVSFSTEHFFFLISKVSLTPIYRIVIYFFLPRNSSSRRNEEKGKKKERTNGN